MRNEQRIETEAIKLALCGIESKGISARFVLLKSVYYLQKCYNEEKDIRYLEWANNHMCAYRELGFPLDEIQFMKECFEQEGMRWNYENTPYKEIKLNKTQVRSMLGRWNPKIQSMPIDQVVDDIMEKTKNKECGVHEYYSGDHIYQLCVTQTESTFYNSSRRQYYTIRGDEERSC